MAIKTLSIICRRMTALDKNLFSHQDLKYKFVGWATTRERALSGIVDYADLQQLSVQNDAPAMELYAVWKERKTNVSYENLKITASNVSYDKTTAPVFYTVTEVKTYEGLSVPYSKTTIANDVAENSSSFGMNGDPNSEIATSLRTLTVSYTHSASGLAATTLIVQGGYTPIFKLNVKKSNYGKIECYVGNLPLAIASETADTITYSSTSKNFTLKAIPNTETTKEWISKTGCVYYSKDYNTRLKHAAAYPNSNSCGSWNTITSQLYKFKSWSGGNINGSTSAQAVVQGSVINPPTIIANFEKLPLLKNTVIGKWNSTWLIAHTTYETYTAYKTVSTWVPTCKTGLKYLRKYGISNMHEGRNGHGYYNLHTEPYTATRANTTYTSYKNKYYGASNVQAPYVLYIPASGKLTIKGRYGTAVYGGKDTVLTGGFALKKYSNLQNVFDDFKTFSAKSDATNDYAATINITFDVKKGDKYQFTSILSKMAIWIESIELVETT